MSEAEVLVELGFRTQMAWSLIQWWTSISFAVMIAAYWGAQKLTKGLIAVIIGLYTFASLTVLVAIVNQAGYILDAYETLRIISEISQLSPLGNGVLEKNGGIAGMIQSTFFVFAFLFTISFVFYCYKYVKHSE